MTLREPSSVINEAEEHMLSPQPPSASAVTGSSITSPISLLRLAQDSDKGAVQQKMFVEAVASRWNADHPADTQQQRSVSPQPNANEDSHQSRAVAHEAPPLHGSPSPVLTSVPPLHPSTSGGSSSGMRRSSSGKGRRGQTGSLAPPSRSSSGTHEQRASPSLSPALSSRPASLHSAGASVESLPLDLAASPALHGSNPAALHGGAETIGGGTPNSIIHTEQQQRPGQGRGEQLQSMSEREHATSHEPPISSAPVEPEAVAAASDASMREPPVSTAGPAASAPVTTLNAAVHLPEDEGLYIASASLPHTPPPPLHPAFKEPSPDVPSAPAEVTAAAASSGPETDSATARPQQFESEGPTHAKAAAHPEALEHGHGQEELNHLQATHAAATELAAVAAPELVRAAQGHTHSDESAAPAVAGSASSHPSGDANSVAPAPVAPVVVDSSVLPAFVTSSRRSPGTSGSPIDEDALIRRAASWGADAGEELHATAWSEDEES